MNKCLKIRNVPLVLILLAFLFSGYELVFSQENIKIAVIDFRKIVQAYNKSEKYSNQFKSEIQKKQKEIDESKEEIIKLREDFAKNVDSLSEKEKEKQQKILEGKIANLQEKVKRSNQELMELDQKMTQEIYEEITKVVADISQKEGYTLVLQSKGVIVYNSLNNDLTDKVITELNKKGKQ